MKDFQFRRIRQSLGGREASTDNNNTIKIKLGNGMLNFYFDILITKYHNYGDYYGMYRTLCALFVTNAISKSAQLRHFDVKTPGAELDPNNLIEITIDDDGNSFLEITHLGKACDCTFNIIPYGFGITDVMSFEYSLMKKSKPSGNYSYTF